MKTTLKRNLCIAAIALIHLIITFITDKSTFLVDPATNPFDYTICKILTYIVLYLFYLTIYKVIIDKNRRSNYITRVLITALPYLIVIIGVAAIKMRGGYLSNDEALIYQNASSLTHYTWFYYITTYYYIVSLMLIPHMYAPIFIKLILEYLIIGYCVLRIKDYFSSIDKNHKLFGRFNYGILLFALFLLYPIIAFTTSAHRLPIYVFCYIFMITMLLFDKLEKKNLTMAKGVLITILGAILTQWRTEGIYLLVLVPILCFLVYENIRHFKPAIALILFSLIVQYAVSIPQNGIFAKDMGAAADDRMKPFYAYTITNMFRNGLDTAKNADDLQIVDKYLSIEKIEAINEYYGDINYEDVLILYQPDFIGVREEATVTDFYNYAEALKRIFKNNPDVFFRTRVGAFLYSALPFHITYSGSDIKSLISFAVSVVKTVSYNLFIPLSIAIILCLYGLFKKRWFTFFVCGGLIAHWFIVFVLAPASYFKYYFPLYLSAYLYLILIIIGAIYNRKHSVKVRFLK